MWATCANREMGLNYLQRRWAHSLRPRFLILLREWRWLGADAYPWSTGDERADLGLACAVGAQLGVECTARDLDIEPMDRGEDAEALDEPTGVNGQVEGMWHVRPIFGPPGPHRQSSRTCL
jgi:hypothetical protein